MSKPFLGAAIKRPTPDCYVVTRAGEKIVTSEDKPASAIAALHRHAERAETCGQEAGRDRRRAA
jgi:hypothetical protein